MSSSDSNEDNSSVASGCMLLCSTSATLSLLRISVDLIQTASQETSKDYKEDHHNVNKASGNKENAKLASDNVSQLNSYGSIQAEEEIGLLSNTSTNSTSPMIALCFPSQHKAAHWSFRVQTLMVILLLFQILLNVHVVIVQSVLLTAVLVVGFGAWLTVRDLPRSRFGIFSRCIYLLSTLCLWLAVIFPYYQRRQETSAGDELIVNQIGLFGILSLVEIICVDLTSPVVDDHPRKKTLSRAAVLTLLKPYFWPDKTSTTAATNRIRAILTWVFVSLSKICNLAAPIFLGWASTELAHENYPGCIWYSSVYATIQFLGSGFKEGQSLVYLKVAQAAFVQLSETSFEHVSLVYLLILF